MTQQRKIYIELMDCGVTYECEDKDDVERAIKEEYERGDIVMGELLTNIAVHGLSVEDVTSIYAGLLNQFEGDVFVQLYGNHEEEELIDMITQLSEEGHACIWEN